jgi:hypothetical protein
MHRALVAFAAMVGASAAITFASGPHSGSLFSLSGWAEIPSTYRRPGSPVSGQFTTGPVNGVTPPYQGQPIPGFSGIIPSSKWGTFFGLPDNGCGAQNNSADFIIGFYEITPHFKTSGIRSPAACSRPSRETPHPRRRGAGAARNFTRSSSGCVSVRAWSSTRSLNASQLSSRLM